MRSRPTSRTCALSTLTLITASLALAGCDKLTPNGQSDTMTLLKAGSERVCIAPDVQKTLRGLILPKPDTNSSADDAKMVADAAASFDITFELTTLQSADKNVNRVTCNTSAKMSEMNGDTRSFAITYDISPSAERPGSFVITGNVEEARTFANNAIDNIVAHQLAAEQQGKEAEEAERAHQQLLTVLTPKWLVGTWIGIEAAPTACANGMGLILAANHTAQTRILNARWALTSDKLHLIGSMPSGPFNKTLTITEADADSFKHEGDEQGAFRRCTREEISDTGLPDVIAPPPETPPN